MTEAERVTLFTALGMIFGGIITTLLNSYLNKKNNFFSSLKNAAEALNITSEELVESLVTVKNLRLEIQEKDQKIKKLEEDYRIIKEITRKLYNHMQEKNIDADLSDKELELLFDTQPLMLFQEKERRKKRNK